MQKSIYLTINFLQGGLDGFGAPEFMLFKVGKLLAERVVLWLLACSLGLCANPIPFSNEHAHVALVSEEWLSLVSGRGSSTRTVQCRKKATAKVSQKEKTTQQRSQSELFHLNSRSPTAFILPRRTAGHPPCTTAPPALPPSARLAEKFLGPPIFEVAILERRSEFSGWQLAHGEGGDGRGIGRTVRSAP